MTRTLQKTAKAVLRELSYKENAVKSMRYLKEMGSEDYSESLRVAEAELKVARRALASLSEEQRDILDAFFVHRGDGFMDKLCKKYCCSQSTVYRMQREALKALTMSLYGRVD